MKLDLEEIKALIEALNEAGLTKLKIKTGEIELELERRVEGVAVAAPVSPMPPPPVMAAPPVESTAAPLPVVEEEEGAFCTAPIVGTFYRTPSPEADAFVEIGDEVEEDTVICIIEAMKVMNEVKSGVKGVIKEVLIENGHPVEFGSKLFRIG